MEIKIRTAAPFQIGKLGGQIMNLPDIPGADLPAEWKVSEKGMEAIRVAVAMAQTKHGLLASVPIVCKGDKCPYADTCILIPRDLVVPGERCPLEIAAIVDRFQSYMEHLNIEPSNIVDMNLLKNLIDLEVQIVRTDKKIASSGDMIERVFAAVDAEGEAHYKPEISKATELKLKLIAEHGKILNLLHATRKDKAGDKLTLAMDPSSYAASLLEKKRIMNAEVIDVTPKDE